MKNNKNHCGHSTTPIPSSTPLHNATVRLSINGILEKDGINLSPFNLFFSEEEYTVFVPTDHAFQRWHPIDWGFYPFSVPEFTESVIINHFVKGRLKQDNIKNGQKMKTVAEREIVFRKTRRYFLNFFKIARVVLFLCLNIK